METNSNHNTAALLHLSMLSQYMIPFGNIIFPAIIWSSTKDRSEYINQQGKQAINFQLSLFLYALILCLVAVPVVFVTVLKNVSFYQMTNDHDWVFENFNISELSTALWFAITAFIFIIMLKVAEFFLIIYAAVKTSNGDNFQYPLTIPFIK